MNEPEHHSVYIAGPMTGYKNFNFPAFFEAAERYSAAGWTVFNPAARDNEHHGTDISIDNEEGSIEKAASEHGFSMREALAADTAWICKHATHIHMLPGWSKSKGATAERALGIALGLEIRGAKE